METYTGLFTDRAMKRIIYDNMKDTADNFVNLAISLDSKLLQKNCVRMHIDFDPKKEIYTIYYINLKTKFQSRCDFAYTLDMSAHMKYMMTFNCIL